MQNYLPFQLQLKYEREKRGWSQADLAEKVQSDFKTVYRWETGKSIPHPFYRQRICQLFGKSAEELGLIEYVKGNENVVPATNREDWGGAPLGGFFYGRENELAQLEQWIITHGCRIVAILGIGGIGKTALSTKAGEHLKRSFDYIFWRSLQDALPLEDFLRQCIQCISGQQQVDLPNRVNEQLSLLIRHLQNHRCLLILDNTESIMQGGRRASQYQDGYENYGRLIQCIGESQHQSCLVLTSREKPKEVALLEGTASPVRSLYLTGIGFFEGQKILKDKGLIGSNEHWAELINLYSGNPLALKLVSQVIREIFEGEIARFLQEEEIAFGEIDDLISQQFQRLSKQEQEILYWLAIEREAVGLEYLFDDLVHPALKGEILATLDSLRRRFLIETRGAAQFTLQPVIMEYVTGELVKSLCKGFHSEVADVWMNYTFYKAHSKEYIQDSQKRLILTPVLQHVLSTFGMEELKRKVYEILMIQRQMYPLQRSYIAGNALKLLIHAGADLRGTDFSYLMIRQAYLQGVALPEVNFTHAHFSSSVFQNTFGNVLSVALSLHDTLLAMGTATGEIWIYQTLSGTPLMSYCEHTDGVWSLAFHPDENTLASGSDDQTIRLWNVSDGRCLGILEGHTNRVWSIAISPDGLSLASGSEDQSIRLWDIRSGTCLKVLYGHTHGVRSLSLASNGQILVSGGDDQTVRVWEMSTGSCLRTLQGYAKRIWSVAFNIDGHSVVSSSEDQCIRLWNTTSGTCTKIFQDDAHRAKVAAFSPDGSLLASGGEDQTVRLWDITTGRCVQVLSGHGNWVRAIAFSPDGLVLASGSEDHAVRIWSVNTAQCIFVLQGHSSWIRSVAFSPNANIIASGGDDQTIRLWQMDTGYCIYVLHGHTGRVRSLSFSPDGKVLASGGEDQSVCLWDVATGQRLDTLNGHANWVRVVAFSPDGQMLASGGDDPSIHLWLLSTKRLMKLLQGHVNRVRSLAFDPSGKILVSGSDDGTIKLWNPQRGECFKTLRSERPYEGMNITKASGLTEAQKVALRILGAIAYE